MPNDGYELKSGKFLTGTISTNTTDVEVARFTIPVNIDIRINALCLIQNTGSVDGYSYWINGLATRKDGYFTEFIGNSSGDGYGNAYNVTGTETDVIIIMKTDGNDIVICALQNGSATCRLATFLETYQVNNVGITAV